MKKFLLLISLIAALLTFASCGGEQSSITVPEGMQIISQSKEDGYVFFGPDAWTVANQAGMGVSYLSGINTTSITFAKAEVPESGLGKESLKEYFNSTKAAFPYKESVTVITECEPTNFGNADKAYKYVYTYKYGDYDIACMQVLVVHSEKLFIFTYTSYGSVTDETSSYRMYIDRAQKAMDNFLFTTDIGDNEQINTEPKRDEDGYVLISDNALTGFDLYVPESYEVVDSSAIVLAKINGKASISLTRATETGVNILHYLNKRHEDMAAITENFTDIKVSVTTNYNKESSVFDTWAISVMPEVDSSLSFGNLEKKTTASYEYKFTYAGTEYHVFQVLGVGRFDGYVFTYTATEDEYSTHLYEVMEIIKSKVNFI